MSSGAHQKDVKWLTKRSYLHTFPHKPADPSALTTAGDEKDISRLVSSVGTPEAARENSG